MAHQKYLTISGGSTVSASPNPKLGYFLEGSGWGAAVATLKVGPDSSNHTIAGVVVQGAPGQARDGEVVDNSSGNLTLTHGISLSRSAGLAIQSLAQGTVTLNGDSTVGDYSNFGVVGAPGPFAPPASLVLNGSLTVSGFAAVANFQNAKVSGHGTINIGPGAIVNGQDIVTMSNVLAGLHVNVANQGKLGLVPRHEGAAIAFHGTITEAAGAKVIVEGAAHSAVREIFHKATGTLDLINKAGTQVAELQFAPGSREYTSINPRTNSATITTDPHAIGTLPTIFVH